MPSLVAMWPIVISGGTDS